MTHIHDHSKKTLYFEKRIIIALCLHGCVYNIPNNAHYYITITNNTYQLVDIQFLVD